MNVEHAAVRASEAAVAAMFRLDAMLQDAAGKSTVIRDGNKTVTITTDQNGHTTITKTNGGVPPLPGAPPEPGVPSLPGFSFADGNIDLIPPRAVEIAYGFFAMCAIMVVGWPLARAFGRRIERQGSVGQLHPAAADQLQRIEQGMDAMAVEIERISESQRFLAKLQSGSTSQRV